MYVITVAVHLSLQTNLDATYNTEHDDEHDDALEDHMSGPPDVDSFPLADASVSACFDVVKAFLAKEAKCER